MAGFFATIFGYDHAKERTAALLDRVRNATDEHANAVNRLDETIAEMLAKNDKLTGRRRNVQDKPD